jgi:hypothetical protein
MVLRHLQTLFLRMQTQDKVGIGTITSTVYTLHVNGGIGATDFYLTGIGTFVDELNVGLGGTVLTVLGIRKLNRYWNCTTCNIY